MPVGKRFAKLAAVFATFFLRGLGNCSSDCAGFGGSNAWVSWGVFGKILVGFEFWLGCGGGGGGDDDGGGGGEGPGGGGA